MHGQATRAGRAGKTAARGIAGAGHPHAPAAIGRLHEHLEHAIFDKHVAARCQAFAVNVGGGVGKRVGGVVHKGDARVGHGVAKAPGKQASTLGHTFAVQRARNHGKKLRGDERIEHHRGALARWLDRAQQSCGAIGGLACGALQVEFLRRIAN